MNESQNASLDLLRPQWSQPLGVNSLLTTRRGGASKAPFDSLNLALHVTDAPECVTRNRQLLHYHGQLPAAPLWLEQVHGEAILLADRSSCPGAAADAAYTRDRGVVLAIMTADCLSVLIASRDGHEIAAVHAGWRGLAAGLIGRVVQQFESQDLCAWLGPAIGPCHYEVDQQVRQAFTDTSGFLPGRDQQHWMMDLAMIAAQQLSQAGVKQVSGIDCCTYCDPRFYSYRRDGVTGRFASLIWRG